MRRICCLAIVSICAISASAQLSGGFGLTGFSTHLPGLQPLNGLGFTVAARYNVLERSRLSLSLELPVTLGHSGDFDLVLDDRLHSPQKYATSVDVPLLCNINVGAGSGKRNEDDVLVFFTGLGVGFLYVTGRETGGFDTSATGYDIGYSKTVFGPAWNIGFRIGMGRRKHKSLELRYLLLVGTAASGESLSSVSVGFNF